MMADSNVGGNVGGTEDTWDRSADVLYTIHQEYYDFVVNAGDIAYCGGDQVCWDHFFMIYQPVHFSFNSFD